jgi:hypothetical protein
MTEYEDNKEFNDAIEDLLARKDLPELNPIRELEVIIFALLCIRTNADGDHIEGKGDPILCRKIPPPFQVLTNGHYLVIADYYFWNHTDDRQKEAALYHALMQIEVEKPEGDGNIKLKTRKPDIRVFPSEVIRYGAHSNALLELREAFKSSASSFSESLAATT